MLFLVLSRVQLLLPWSSFSPLALADIPKIISYQGKVADTGGNPVPDGTYDMQFSIYTHHSAAIDPIWASGTHNVEVTGGIFNVLLGTVGVAPLDLDFSLDLWLEVTFEGVVQSPRQQFASVGFAYMASGLVPGTEVSGSVTAGMQSAIVAENTATVGFGLYAKGYNCGVSALGGTYGVYGQCESTNGRGVYGNATATAGTNYAIYGQTYSTSGYAGYFIGDVHVTGSINKSACSFLIDHPLDPENKLLRHNCMESPEHLVVYRGKARLIAVGEVAVQMPDYFSALTKEEEASIHLTPVGKPFLTGADWNSGFQGFTIYGESHRAVFWEVLADRADPVIRRLARPVEEEKSPNNKYCDRGKLLYPEAYGYPKSMGRDYEQLEREKARFEEVRRRIKEERAARAPEREAMVEARAPLSD